MDSSSFSASSKDSPISSLHSPGNVQSIKFCQWCGGPTKHGIPEGEERLRAICSSCGKIAYQNPKMVVGCLVEHDNKALLCKRKIEPSYGLWTLPAGYLEIGESAMEGAIRETREEANADVEVISPFAQLDIPLPLIGQYVEDIMTGKPKFHYGTINKRPGTSPSDIHSYTLDHHMQSLTQSHDKLYSVCEDCMQKKLLDLSAWRPYLLQIQSIHLKISSSHNMKDLDITG